VAPQSEVLIVRPAAALARYVRRYVGYRQTGFAPALHTGPPSRHVTVILSLDAPLTIVESPDPTAPMSSMQGVAHGLHSRAALFMHHGNEHAIGIELTPLATRAVFGLPAKELANVMVDATDLLGKQGTELMERLAQPVGWKARFALLDEHLTARLPDRAPDLPGEVVEAWRRLTGDPPATNVSSLAKDLGWSGRHLTMRFQQEVGLPPRQLRRVVRVERSSRLLRRGSHRTITDVAVTSGYHDHAHMVHEWRSIVGCTPTDWRAEEADSCRPLRIDHGVHRALPRVP
jgi:AraC-like DNA-binding protein